MINRGLLLVGLPSIIFVVRLLLRRLDGRDLGAVVTGRKLLGGDLVPDLLLPPQVDLLPEVLPSINFRLKRPIALLPDPILEFAPNSFDLRLVRTFELLEAVQVLLEPRVELLLGLDLRRVFVAFCKSSSYCNVNLSRRNCSFFAIAFFWSKLLSKPMTSFDRSRAASLKSICFFASASTATFHSAISSSASFFMRSSRAR